jgi:hypothetical protein
MGGGSPGDLALEAATGFLVISPLVLVGKGIRESREGRHGPPKYASPLESVRVANWIRRCGCDVRPVYLLLKAPGILAAESKKAALSERMKQVDLATSLEPLSWPRNAPAWPRSIRLRSKRRRSSRRLSTWRSSWRGVVASRRARRRFARPSGRRRRIPTSCLRGQPCMWRQVGTGPPLATSYNATSHQN